MSPKVFEVDYFKFSNQSVKSFERRVSFRSVPTTHVFSMCKLHPAFRNLLYITYFPQELDYGNLIRQLYLIFPATVIRFVVDPHVFWYPNIITLLANQKSTRKNSNFREYGYFKILESLKF